MRGLILCVYVCACMERVKRIHVDDKYVYMVYGSSVRTRRVYGREKCLGEKLKRNNKSSELELDRERERLA